MSSPRMIADRYELGDVIGHGGMGTVHQGHDVRLDRPVAIKVLRPNLAADPAIRSRFEHEARMAARISDPHVVAIYDTGEDDDAPYIVMERLPGRTLADEIREGPFTSARLHQVGTEILAALAAAHATGVVHRDVKPGNVLVAHDGHVKVADFGIAKTLDDVSETIALFGTPAYIAPERLVGHQASHASDLFSVGVVLYEAATGAPPFRAETAVATAHAIVHEDAPSLAARRPDLDAGLVAAIDRAMSKSPDDRFPSATAMRAALGGDDRVVGVDAADTVRVDADRTQALGAATLVAPTPPAPAETSPRSRPSGRVRSRRPIAAVVAACTVIAVLALAAWALHDDSSPLPTTTTQPQVVVSTTVPVPVTTQPAPSTTVKPTPAPAAGAGAGGKGAPSGKTKGKNK
ncbi:MAG: serine/threonine-protein kinase [Acidimicrobiia bacterium]